MTTNTIVYYEVHKESNDCEIPERCTLEDARFRLSLCSYPAYIERVTVTITRERIES